jgi:hypothetical protein
MDDGQIRSSVALLDPDAGDAKRELDQCCSGSDGAGDWCGEIAWGEREDAVAAPRTGELGS